MFHVDHVLVFKYRAPTTADCNQRNCYLGWVGGHILGWVLCVRGLCCLLARTLVSSSRPDLSWCGQLSADLFLASYSVFCFFWALGHNICLVIPLVSEHLLASMCPSPWAVSPAPVYVVLCDTCSILVPHSLETT